VKPFNVIASQLLML